MHISTELMLVLSWVDYLYLFSVDHSKRPAEISRRNSKHRRWSHFIIVAQQTVNMFTATFAVVNSILSPTGPGNFSSLFSGPNFGILISPLQ